MSDELNKAMSNSFNKDLCPICLGGIPNDENKGEYPGATSRFDNKTEICSECGTREALIPYHDIACRLQMEAAQEQNDWEAWKECVLSDIMQWSDEV